MGKLPKGFIVHDELIEDLIASDYTPEDIGLLMIATVKYRHGEELPNMDKALKGVFNTKIKKLVDMDIEKYQAVCERNKRNINKRWEKSSEDTKPYETIPNDTTRIPNDTTGYETIPNILIANSKEQIANNIDGNKKVATRPKKSKPESATEVREYRQSLGYGGFDAQRFFDYYEANGWVQGKGKPIKDWKAAVRNWQKMRKQYEPTSIVGTPPSIDKGYTKVVVEPVYKTEKTNGGFFTKLLKEVENES